MAYDYALDLETVFDTDEFAQMASYTRQGFAPAPIPVIFDKEYAVAEAPGTQGVGTSAPTALCKTADVLNVAAGDQLLIGAALFYVIEARNDGAGVTTLLLSEDPQ